MTKALILCAHRQMTLPTFGSIMNLMASKPDWRVIVEAGDALISRVRSIAVSRWMREYPDDEAFLMVDDDFQFTADAAEAIIDLAIEKRGIAAGVTPLRSGHYTAIVPLTGEREMWLAPDTEPIQIKWAGGALAYHRDVFVRMAETMPLLHKDDTIAAFWPFFMPMIHTLADGRQIYLSEDYAPVLPDTPVLGADWRWRPIADYDVGDRVMAVDEFSPLHSSRRYRSASVTGTFRRASPLWRIVTDENEVVTTMDHRWLVKRNWRRALGRPFGASMSLGPPARWDWTQTDEIRPGDFIAGAVPRVSSPTINVDYKAGYVQGLWHTDGTISRNDRLATLMMCDREALERARSYMIEMGLQPTEIRLRGRKAEPRPDRQGQRRPIFAFGVYHKEAAARMASLIDYEPIPSEDFARGYLAGAYDGDGSHGGHAIYIHNLSDVIKYRAIQAGHMIGVNFVRKERHNVLTGHDPIHRFWMATCPAIQRKLTPIGQPGNDGVVRGREMHHRPVRVLAIEPVGKVEETRCLSTEAGTFVADGLASHNCHERARQLGFSVWVQPAAQIGHLSEVMTTPQNMPLVHEAIYGRPNSPSGSLSLERRREASKL